MSFNYDQPSRISLIKHFQKLGIENSISIPIIDLFQSWVNHSGPEWAIERLKTFKVAFLNLTAGQKPDYSWIEHDGLLPKGPFKPIFRWSIRNPKKAKKFVNLLMIYTGFKARVRWTDAQWKKSMTSITTTPSETESFMIDKESEHFSMYLFAYRHQVNYLSTTDKKPSFRLGNARDVKYGGTDTLSSFMGDIGYQCIRLGVDSFLPEIVKKAPLLKGSNFMVGDIGVIQEGGFKARVVAMPSLGIQTLFKDLNTDLLNRLKRVPWDYTHDQQAAVVDIHYRMKSHRSSDQFHSVDLSSATDKFPAALQLVLLDMIYPIFGDLMRSVLDHGLWSISKEKPLFPGLTPSVSYGMGQPMGLNGSFPLFALTHGLYLSFLAKCLGLTYGKDCMWWILGDDVVIHNDRLHAYYVSRLSQMGVPISYHKCLDSSRQAEFASRVITPTNVYLPVKVGKVDRSNILQKMHTWSLDQVRSADDALVLWAVIPDILGGPGFSKSGWPLNSGENSRADLALEILSSIEREKRVPPTISPFAKLLKRFLNIIPWKGIHPDKDSDAWVIPTLAVPTNLDYMSSRQYAEHHMATTDNIVGVYLGNLSSYSIRMDIRLSALENLSKERPDLVERAREILGT